MFNKKKKAEEQFTPSDLEKLNDDARKQQLKGKSIFQRFSARRSAAELTKTQLWRRRVFWILSTLVLLLLILWIISTFVSQYGDLVIGVERGARTKGIVISEVNDIEKGTTILSADKVQDVTNITYDWLPLKELDAKDGSHNGKNYLAYTFYVHNAGTEKLTYKGNLDIQGVAKSMDEAVRIMVYKNGEPEIYAKRKYKSEEAEENTTKFITDTRVMSTETKDIKPGQSDKYTIVAWVEGNDPECVNDIMGGFMRMQMLFGIAEDDEPLQT